MLPNIRTACLYTNWVNGDDRGTPAPDDAPEPAEQGEKAATRLKSPQPATRFRPDGQFDLEDARMIIAGGDGHLPYAPKLRELTVGSIVYAVRS